MFAPMMLTPASLNGDSIQFPRMENTDQRLGKTIPGAKQVIRMYGHLCRPTMKLVLFIFPPLHRPMTIGEVNAWVKICLPNLSLP